MTDITQTHAPEEQISEEGDFPGEFIAAALKLLELPESNQEDNNETLESLRGELLRTPWVCIFAGEINGNKLLPQGTKKSELSLSQKFAFLSCVEKASGLPKEKLEQAMIKHGVIFAEHTRENTRMTYEQILGWCEQKKERFSGGGICR